MNYGLKVYFPTWYRLAFQKFVTTNKTLLEQTQVFPPFESIAGNRESWPTEAEVNAEVGKSGPENVRLRSDTFWLATVVDAVDLLREAGVQTVSRLYGKRVQTPRWVWDGFEPGEGERRLRTIVENVAREYDEFLAENRLTLRRARFKHNDCARVYRFTEPTVPDSSLWIQWLEISPRGNRPAYSVVSGWTEANGMVTIDGEQYRIHAGGSRDASGLFARSPMLNAIYAMLEEDLTLSYPSERWSDWRPLI